MPGAKRDIGIGMVGYGFMGRAHSHAWHTVARAFPDVPLTPRLTAICGRNRTALGAAAGRLGWASAETDWHALVERDDIGLIDICSPGDLHAPIAIAALEAGKQVLCEKPLANTLEEASAMAAAAIRAYPGGARAMVGFNYRRVPALALAHRYVGEGRIGVVRHVRAVYLQDWLADPSAPMTWRMQAERAGSGALGDLGAHIVDLARYLTGEEIRVASGLSATFTRERPLGPLADGSGAGSGTGSGTDLVTVDDAVVFTARLAPSGALATFEATRCAPGRKNGLRIEINGAAGSLVFDLERLNELEFYAGPVRSLATGPASGGSGGSSPRASTAGTDNGDSGYRRILVTEPSHPYLSAWWPPGHVLGWEHTFVHQAFDLLTAIADGTQPEPSFADGLAVQRVLDAVQKLAVTQ